MTCLQWLRLLDKPSPTLSTVLRNTYGTDEASKASRLKLLRAVLNRFHERFGDQTVRLFRAPGRINLRGMHVDTHGGYLNLMTHQREVLIAAQQRDDTSSVFVNVDSRYEEAVVRPDDLRCSAAFRQPWTEFILSAAVRDAIDTRRGHWSHYLSGAVLSIQQRFPHEPLRGMNAVVGSDLPRGAALSSSAALCVGLCNAVLTLNNKALDALSLILAARDAEWYTGSRCGLSDQAAIVLGGRNELVNLALFARDLTLSGLRRIEFPDALSILVINSCTERSLSGAAIVAYTRNRFAYSLAMEILRQEMRRHTYEPAFVDETDRLSRVTQERIPALLHLLRAIPDSISLEDLRIRYDLPEFDAAYRQNFGSVPEDQRPNTVNLRGPLLFGIAESERARHFIDVLERKQWEWAGRLMSLGHDGDRLLDAFGRPYHCDVSDTALSSEESIEMFPGAYGASAPVLDALVDVALRNGALGASLTGAGMAGVVLALCRAQDATGIAHACRDWLASAEYVQRAGCSLAAEQLEQAVMLNRAPAAAGELCV